MSFLESPKNCISYKSLFVFPSHRYPKHLIYWPALLEGIP
uniref:Uncharacterized protein n=1 Tax=Tetranychus urticae TaxID=32264 RepID=T1K6Y8_TETUR